MVNFFVQLSAQLENIEQLQLPNNLEFYFKIQCNQCHEVASNWISFNAQELYPITHSRGDANLVVRCKFCSRENSATFVGSPRAYSAESSGQFQTVAELDCRGLEPVEVELRDGVVVKANSGAHFEDVDLSEKEWVEYDEKSGDSLSIMELAGQIRRA
ncbi:hypothetical protein BDF19DRAFT_433915 [Syncephalis fuscata]|nr:hypothetical protein BDF19DRAFT_433915 [Syncephalis fuscata]